MKKGMESMDDIVQTIVSPPGWVGWNNLLLYFLYISYVFNDSIITHWIVFDYVIVLLDIMETDKLGNTVRYILVYMMIRYIQ